MILDFSIKQILNLRTALRILKPIKYFQAHNDKELYKKLKEIDWSKIFKLNNTFSTSATTNSDTFSHSKFASLLKDAIADKFREKYKKRPNVDHKKKLTYILIYISLKILAPYLLIVLEISSQKRIQIKFFRSPNK